MEKTTIQVCVEKNLYEQLKAAASAQGLSLSSFVRMLLIQSYSSENDDHGC